MVQKREKVDLLKSVSAESEILSSETTGGSPRQQQSQEDLDIGNMKIDKQKPTTVKGLASAIGSANCEDEVLSLRF